MEGAKNNMRFDWRWIAVILVIALIIAGQSLPWPVLLLVLAAGGGYLLYMGWNTWKDNAAGGAGSRVTYWRGQRIELEPEKEKHLGLPPFQAIGPALIYLILGTLLVVGALGVLIEQLGG
jgi:hypothetical protein